MNSTPNYDRFVVPNRPLRTFKAMTKPTTADDTFECQAGNLEEVVAYHKLLNYHQAPMDREFSLSKLRVKIHDNRITGTFPGMEKFLFNEHSFAQVCKSVLGGYTSTFVKRCGTYTPETAGLMEDIFRHFLSDDSLKDKEEFFRFVWIRNPRFPTQRIRMLRAKLSTGYGEFSDPTMLEALMSHDEYRNLPVLEHSVSDHQTTLRLALEEVPPIIPMKKPIPMLQLCNSPVGLRSLRGDAAIWTAICTNGMVNITNTSTFKRQHRGNASDIAQIFENRLEHIRTATAKMMQDYGQAQKIKVVWEKEGVKDDKLAAMVHTGRVLKTAKTKEKRLTNRMIANAQDAFASPLIASEKDTLGSIVDAITLAAQKQSQDMQSMMESLASRVLFDSLEKAKKEESSKIKIPLPFSLITPEA